MPGIALELELKPRGRRAATDKAVYRYRKRDFAKSEPPPEQQPTERRAPQPVETLKDEFARAAADASTTRDRRDRGGADRSQP